MGIIKVKNMKFNKKGVFLAVALIIIFIVLVSTEEKPTVLPQPGSCEEFQQKINALIADANYCEVATDCVLQNYPCPFGCWKLHNKDADLSEIENKIDSFENKCTTCLYGCGLKPDPESFECMNNKCVVRVE